MMNKMALILFVLISCKANAQDSLALPEKLTVNGYIKNMQTLTFDKNFKETVSGNLLHNRVNFKWKPSVKITFAAEFRNRFFWGEEVNATPGFDSLLRNENELVNMQKAWVNRRSLVLHSNVERLYIDWRSSSWNVRIGRQRINWGVTTTWNPNDIFNTYNFLDFDYEERPGIDGAKMQYLVNESVNLELAFANTGEKAGHISALKYNLNKWGYDMQLLTGWYKHHVTVGAGWAGNIKEAGFKGEVQYFFAGKDSAAHLNMSLEGDYMFKKGWYMNLGFLLNKNGLYKTISDPDAVDLKISPENLMPAKWNFMVTAAKEITPLFSANLSVLYAPGTNLFILFPSLKYNMATNLDLNLVWQSFFASLDNHFKALNHRGFLRMKWSF